MRIAPGIENDYEVLVLNGLFVVGAVHSVQLVCFAVQGTCYINSSGNSMDIDGLILQLPPGTVPRSLYCLVYSGSTL